MHIILVSDRLAKARSIAISPWHLCAAAVAAFFLFAGVSLSGAYLAVRHAAEIKLPLLQELVRATQLEEARRTEKFTRDNLNAMAVKLGEMQAQLTRLDALGERLSSVAGIRASDFRFGEIPARGGALPTSVMARDFSLDEFGKQLDAVARQMETHTEYLGLLENQLLDARVKQKLTPTALPVQTGAWNASGFGWRIDPITGQQAMHEGIDFLAEAGTPIRAAAAGVVITAEYHQAYGYMVEVDHGGDLITRYGHASKLLVKAGQVVDRGEQIALVGSTGRSTGPHLHFEVRYKGAAQNPARFLVASKSGRSSGKR